MSIEPFPTLYEYEPIFETMKKLILVAAMVLPLLVMAQRRPKIKGNRTVTEVRDELPPFNAIELNDDLDIRLKKSFGEGYEIVADDNLIDILKFEIVDSTLVISSYYTVTTKKQFDITIKYKDLKAITVRDGKIKGEDEIAADALYLNVFGPASLEVRANAFTIDLAMENTSKGEFWMDVDSLNVSLRNRSDANIYVAGGTSKVTLQDNGAVTMEGTTEDLELIAGSNTKFKGEKFESGNAKVQVDMAAVARVKALKTFELASRDNAKTFLYGDPQIAVSEFMDTSQLVKKKSD